MARLALSEGAERALGAHAITAARWAAEAAGVVGRLPVVQQLMGQCGWLLRSGEWGRPTADFGLGLGPCHLIKTCSPLPVALRSLPAMVDAAWELHSRLLALTPPPDGSSATSAAAAAAAGGAAAGGRGGGGGGGGGGDENRLPASMANMAAVASQRQRLQGLQRTFLDKATTYLQQEFGAVADGPLQRLAAAGGSGSLRLRPADHGALRRRAAELAPLLEVVGVLRPAAAVAPREAYGQAVNNLLRREAHQAAAEARRMAAAADAGGSHEPDLLDRAAAAGSTG